MTGPPEVDLQNASSVEDLFHAAADSLRTASCRRGAVHVLPDTGRLLITGDLHDHLEHWNRILHTAELDASPDNHVLLQELIHGERLVNGMDFSFRMLARVAGAVLTWPGQVHPVLGNHELAQYTRRPVSKGAGNSVELFEDAVDWVFGDAAGDVIGAIDDFFSAMPLGVRTARGLLCTHSLPDAARMAGFDPDILDRQPVPEDYEGLTGSAWMLTWGRRHDPDILESLADRWNVELFCIGHQSVPEGVRQDGPRLIAINSDHARGVVIPWDLADEPTPDALLSCAVMLQTISLPQGGDA